MNRKMSVLLEPRFLLLFAVAALLIFLAFPFYQQVCFSIGLLFDFIKFESLLWIFVFGSEFVVEISGLMIFLKGLYS